MGQSFIGKCSFGTRSFGADDPRAPASARRMTKVILTASEVPVNCSFEEAGFVKDRRCNVVHDDNLNDRSSRCRYSRGGTQVTELVAASSF